MVKNIATDLCFSCFKSYCARKKKETSDRLTKFRAAAIINWLNQPFTNIDCACIQVTYIAPTSKYLILLIFVKLILVSLFAGVYLNWCWGYTGAKTSKPPQTQLSLLIAMHTVIVSSEDSGTLIPSPTSMSPGLRISSYCP